MLIEGGYAFSMKALLDKSSSEETALAARRAYGNPFAWVKASLTRFLDLTAFFDHPSTTNDRAGRSASEVLTPPAPAR